jgi:hypothetical protein
MFTYHLLHYRKWRCTRKFERMVAFSETKKCGENRCNFAFTEASI